jgi:hypothetical protein
MRAPRVLSWALALLFALPAGTAGAEGFLAACDDLPLPPGLTEVAGSGVSFDTPQGRIVEAYARGALRPEAVLDFYAGTLPQLGWSRESATRYRRESEVLSLDPAAEGRGTLVHFTISPE